MSSVFPGAAVSAEERGHFLIARVFISMFSALSAINFHVYGNYSVTEVLWQLALDR